MKLQNIRTSRKRSLLQVWAWQLFGFTVFLPSNKQPLDVECDLSTNALVLTIRIAALEKPVRASARAKEIYKWG